VGEDGNEDHDYDDEHRRHQIFLGGSGISQDSLDWLQAADSPHVCFVAELQNASEEEVDATAPLPQFASIPEATSFWEHERQMSSQPSKPLPVLSRTETLTVVQFLSKLRGAREFGITETRRALAQRVIKALELLQHPECRTEVIQRMEDSLDACHDKPIWALNQLTLVGLIASARGDREELFQLGRRVMNLQIVHKHVEKKIASLTWVDDVCVYLRFEIELREPLHLPVDATAMIFSNFVAISDQELKAAEQEASEVTEEGFEMWLSSWSEWRRQERLETAQLLRWDELDIDDNIEALRVPRSNLSGERLRDPILLRGQVWSLCDLLRHWIQTGLDLTNEVLPKEEIVHALKRVNLPKRRSLRQSLRRSLRGLVNGIKK